MNTNFPKEKLDELVPLARLASNEEPGFWDRVANFFDQQKLDSEALVEPRQIRQ